MLKFPSWLFRSASRAGGLGRLAAALFGALLVADVSAQIQLTSSAYSVNEDDGSIRIAIRRFGAPTNTATVRVSAIGAPPPAGAVDGQDFISRTSTLTFGTNVSEVFFDVVILDN